MTPLGAVGLAVAAYSFWVLADTSLKLAGASQLTAPQVIGTVGFFEALLLVVGSLGRGGPRVLWPRHPLKQVLRSCLDLANNLCVVVAVRHVPLALFYILVFFAPLITVLLAAAVLREPVGLRRGLAIVVGFVGVVVAVHPSGGALHPGYGIGYLACLVCVLCFSVSVVWSRVLAQTETPESLTFVSGLVMLLAGSALTTGHWQPLSWHLAGVLLLTGLFSLGGSFCFFLALRHTAAAKVVPFHYTQLLTGAALAYAIWHERPTVAMLGGAVLIVGAGWYTAMLSRAESRLPAEMAREPQPAATP